jgi:hypothetical protein
LSGSAVVGTYSDWDVTLGLSVFGAGASGAVGSWTDTFTGADSAVVITGTSTPGGAASITQTNGPGTATSSVTGSNGGVANTVAVGATNNVAAVTPDLPGFVISSAVTDVTTGASYGGIGAASGGIFIASGNIDGLSVSTTVNRNIFFGGADLTIGLSGELNDAATAAVYAGPSLRLLNQGITTGININIPEVLPSNTTHPEFKISIDDDLSSQYVGAVVGSNVSFPASEDVTITFGAQGAIYDVHTSWTGQDTYSTCCGATTVPPTTSPTLSVNGPANSQDLGHRMAFGARANAAVSMALAENKTLSLGGNVEYLMVPTLDHAGLTQTGAGQNFTPGAIPATTVFGWGGMVSVGLTGSLTGHF